MFHKLHFPPQHFAESSDQMHACDGDVVPASKVKWVTASLPSTCQDQERLLKSQSPEGFPLPFYRLSIHRIERPREVGGPR